MPARKRTARELKAIGAMIKRLREQAGMTQRELGFQVDAPSRTIQRWENPTTGGSTLDAVDLLKVFAALGVEVPEVPRYQSIGAEVARIHERLDDIIPALSGDPGSLLEQMERVASPTTDILEQLVTELTSSTPPTPRRRVEIRRGVEAFADANRLATRLVVALRARLEAADTGR